MIYIIIDIHSIAIIPNLFILVFFVFTLVCEQKYLFRTKYLWCGDFFKQKNMKINGRNKNDFSKIQKRKNVKTENTL